MIFKSFEHARACITERFLDSSFLVEAPTWQGIDVSKKPEMAMRELLNFSFQVHIRNEHTNYWAKDTGCNLPFADVHFGERVGGKPTNPGEAWMIWPWAHSAANHLTESGKRFTHTYQERFWPKKAGIADRLKDHVRPRKGIRYEYADLNDLIAHLEKDPLSRQAYLPIWFPEDGTCEGRRPCTLGYHFILRHDVFHHTYYIRSCDFTRHWGDDCYLAIRLHLWILDELRARNDMWKQVRPGMFTMHIVSLHCFLNDFAQMKQRASQAPQKPSV